MRMLEEKARMQLLFRQMLTQAASMITDALRSVRERDPELGRRVIADDDIMDRLERRVDEGCIQLLALHHPVAGDLREVVAMLKASTDLERVGDLAVNIVKRGFELGDGPGLEADDTFQAMAAEVEAMLRLVVDAWQCGDGTALGRLRAAEARVDEHNRVVFRWAIALMAAHPDQGSRAIALTNISKNLERIGDHVINLSEHLAFRMVGRDMRHPRVGDH